VIIRPFDYTSDADYAAVLTIHNLCHPAFADDVAHWKARDQVRDPKYKYGRFVAEADGRIVGYYLYYQNPYVYHPRKYSTGLDVHPDFRRQGIGSALFDHLLQSLEPFDPLAVKAQTSELDEAGLRFLQKRGFQETNRRWRSSLDVTSFDLSLYAGLEEKLRLQGIEIKTWPELEGDPDRERKLYAVDMESNQDIPEPEPVTPPPLEQYLTDIFGDVNYIPEALFIAVHDGRYVGRSSLNGKRARKGELDTDYTGVARAYRGRGIALALKLRGIAYAKAHGYHTITTDNHSTNWPMLSLNERLGFVKQPATVYFVKWMGTPK